MQDLNSTATAEPTVDGYERSTEVFGRTFSRRVTAHRVDHVDGWAVLNERDRIEAWFVAHEHACRWVDMMIGGLS